MKDIILDGIIVVKFVYQWNFIINILKNVKREIGVNKMKNIIIKQIYVKQYVILMKDIII